MLEAFASPSEESAAELPAVYAVVNATLEQYVTRGQLVTLEQLKQDVVQAGALSQSLVDTHVTRETAKGALLCGWLNWKLCPTADLRPVVAGRRGTGELAVVGQMSDTWLHWWARQRRIHGRVYRYVDDLDYLLYLYRNLARYATTLKKTGTRVFRYVSSAESREVGIPVNPSNVVLTMLAVRSVRTWVNKRFNLPVLEARGLSDVVEYGNDVDVRKATLKALVRFKQEYRKKFRTVWVQGDCTSSWVDMSEALYTAIKYPKYKGPGVQVVVT